MNEMNHVETETFDRVRDLLIREFGIKPSKIKPEARIREDLGICGDDGFDMFTALHDQFGVDLADYDHEQYFEPEMWSSGAFFTKEWWTQFKHPQTITVAQLVQAVRTGKWKKETPNQSFERDE